MTDLEQRARRLTSSEAFQEWNRDMSERGGGLTHEQWTLVNNVMTWMQERIVKALRTIQAETREADAQAVNGLIGKDSGNWNRAIAYAVDAIRKKGRE